MHLNKSLFQIQCCGNKFLFICVCMSEKSHKKLYIKREKMRENKNLHTLAQNIKSSRTTCKIKLIHT